MKVLISEDIFNKLEGIREDRKINSLSQALGEAVGTYSFLVKEINQGNKLWLQKGDTDTELKFKSK
jgi:hypothetical protein